MRLVASDPPGAPGPRPQGGALLLELLARGRNGGTARDLWPGPRGRRAARRPRSSPRTSSSALLCVLGRAGRRFGPGDEELLAALADQTAMGMERAELIARLTARDRVKDLFEALASGAVGRRGPARRAGRMRPGPPARRRSGRRRARRRRRADWDDRLRSARGTAARSRPGGLRGPRPRRRARASCSMPDAGGGRARRRRLRRGRPRRARGVGVSAPGRGVAGRAPGAARGRARDGDRARRCGPPAARVGYEQLGAYKYLAHVRSRTPPRDRHWTAVTTLLDHDARRRTSLLDTLEEYLARRRSVAEHGARAVHPPEHAAPAARPDRARRRPAPRRGGPARARARRQARPAGRCASARRRLSASQTRSAA